MSWSPTPLNDAIFATDAKKAYFSGQRVRVISLEGNDIAIIQLMGKEGKVVEKKVKCAKLFEPTQDLLDGL